MKRKVQGIFPDPETADEDGLVAVGGPVVPELVIEAYCNGIFPWPDRWGDVGWFSPGERAVLFLNQLRIGRSNRKTLKRASWQLTFNRDFDAVIAKCAEVKNRGAQNGTWISEDIVSAYGVLHRAGAVHSVECWHGAELVGGLYGVGIGGMFAGESMFYRESGASKAALMFLSEFLSSHGVTWIDCQVMTPLFESLGAQLIPRRKFLDLLSEALSAPPPPWPTPVS